MSQGITFEQFMTFNHFLDHLDDVEILVSGELEFSISDNYVGELVFVFTRDSTSVIWLVAYVFLLDESRNVSKQSVPTLHCNLAIIVSGNFKK